MSRRFGSLLGMTAASALAVAGDTSTTCRWWRHAYLDQVGFRVQVEAANTEEEIEQLFSVLGGELAARLEFRSAT